MDKCVQEEVARRSAQSDSAMEKEVVAPLREEVASLQSEIAKRDKALEEREESLQALQKELAEARQVSELRICSV